MFHLPNPLFSVSRPRGGMSDVAIVLYTAKREICPSSRAKSICYEQRKGCYVGNRGSWRERRLEQRRGGGEGRGCCVVEMSNLVPAPIGVQSHSRNGRMHSDQGW